MAISPEAIQNFLSKPIPWVPECKGMPADQLDQLIIDATGRLPTYITEPRMHQREGLAFALHMRRCLLFYWMRLGKSKIALDWAMHLLAVGLSTPAQGKGIIIAHAPIGAEVWETEAPKHSSLRVRAVSSGPDAEDDFIAAAEDPDVDALVIAHSTLQLIFTEKRPNRKGKPKLYPNEEALSIAAGYFDWCVIDEIHLCANPGTVRFKIAEQIVGHCRFRLGLTGTPIGRFPQALWAQVYLIDEGELLGRNYYFFEQAFGKPRQARFGPKRIEYVFNKALMPILQDKLRAISLSYGKGEVKSAEVFAGKVELKMGAQQREAYYELIGRIREMEDSDERRKEAAFVRLRQIASGFVPFSDDEGETRMMIFPDSAKLAWLDEFLADAPDQQCLIFHEFKPSGMILEQAMQRHKLAYARLEGTPKARKEAQELFKAGKAQFLITNTVIGGTAIDLPMADYLLFFESPLSPRVREQAEARPMARGDRPLFLDDLICAPIEKRILEFIREGRDLSAELIHSRRSWKGLLA